MADDDRVESPISGAAEQEVAALLRLTSPTHDATGLILRGPVYDGVAEHFEWQFGTAEPAMVYCRTVEQRLPASYVCTESLSRLHCFRHLGRERVDLDMRAQTSREATLVRVSADIVTSD